MKRRAKIILEIEKLRDIIRDKWDFADRDGYVFDDPFYIEQDEDVSELVSRIRLLESIKSCVEVDLDTDQLINKISNVDMDDQRLISRNMEIMFEMAEIVHKRAELDRTKKVLEMMLSFDKE